MALLLRAAHRDRALTAPHLHSPLSSLHPQGQLVADILYAALTTLSGRQTLGEEAAGLIPVHVPSSGAGPQVPSTQRLAALVVLGVFGRRVLLRFLRAETVDLLERLHHVFFLWMGKYLGVSRRLSSVSYVVRSGGLGGIGWVLPLLASVNWVGGLVGGLRDKAWESVHCQSHALSAKHGRVEGTSTGTRCPLCESPSSATLAATVPCGHLACWPCLQRWVSAEGGCPVCREPTPGLVPLLNIS